MHHPSHTASATERSAHRSWQDLAHRFTSDRDCLAAFIALEAAEVLAGIKPANLICVRNQERACGRNLYHLWRVHGKSLLRRTSLRVRRLRESDSSVLLFFYRADLLDTCLRHRGARALLRKVGYRRFAPEPVLQRLAIRMTTGDFPHEIGILLGYPLKDVAGFAGWVNLPLACSRLWKIYGAPETSVALAERYRTCRCRMAEELQTSSPVACLQQPRLRVA